MAQSLSATLTRRGSPLYGRGVGGVGRSRRFAGSGLRYLAHWAVSISLVLGAHVLTLGGVPGSEANAISAPASAWLLGQALAAGLAGWFAMWSSRGVGFRLLFSAALVELPVLFLILARGVAAWWDPLLGQYWVVHDGLNLFDEPIGYQLFGHQWPAVAAGWVCAALVVATLVSSWAYLLSAGRTWVAETTLLGRRLKREGLGGSGMIALLGVVLSVALLVAVNAVMTGYLRDVEGSLLATNAHLVMQEFGRDFDEYQEVAERVMEVPEVEAWTPFVYSEAVATSGSASEAVSLKGVDAASVADVIGLEEQLCSDALCEEQGALSVAHALGDEKALLVGQVLARTLALKVDDPIWITVSNDGANMAPTRRAFRVAGIFKSGIHQFDAHLVYANIGYTQRMLGMGDRVGGVELRLNDASLATSLRPRLREAVKAYSIRFVDWQELNSPIFEGLRAQKAAMFAVLCMMVVVAAFNIASVLFMSVVERSKEIGILKSLGTRPARIVRLFVLEGWVIGLAGTALGLVLGALVAFAIGAVGLEIASEVYMVGDLSVVLEPLDLSLTAIAALTICHLATLYPALRGARLEPIDAIRRD